MRGLVRPGSRRRDAGVRQSGVATPTVASVRQFHLVAWWFHRVVYSFHRRLFRLARRTFRYVSWFHAALVRYGRTVSQAAGKQVSSQVSSGARGRRTASVHTFSSQFHHRRRRRRRRCRRRCCCCCCCCSHSRGKPSSHRATA